MAAIWGFAVKGFIDPVAKENFYRDQIEELDTIGKVRKKENFIVQEAVIRPAVASSLGHPVSDDEFRFHRGAAYKKLRNGKLDAFVDFDRIEAVIRERSMIPSYGLENYLKTFFCFFVNVFLFFSPENILLTPRIQNDTKLLSCATRVLM